MIIVILRVCEYNEKIYTFEKEDPTYQQSHLCKALHLINENSPSKCIENKKISNKITIKCHYWFSVRFYSEWR